MISCYRMLTCACALWSGLDCTANNFELVYSRQRISPNSFPTFNYIFPKSFMIFQQELLDAAVSLWRNIITKGFMKQIWCVCPGSNRGSQWCHSEKITQFASLIQALAACVRIAAGPSELHKVLHTVGAKSLCRNTCISYFRHLELR